MAIRDSPRKPRWLAADEEADRTNHGRKRAQPSDDRRAGPSTIGTTLARLASMLAAPHPLSSKADASLEQVREHGQRYGFVNAEAVEVIRMALSAARGGDRMRVRVAHRLIGCIRPAPNQLLGPAFVLTVLSALGGAPTTGLDLDGHDTSFDEEEGAHSAIRMQHRQAVDLAVQNKALQLLLCLYVPPAIWREEGSATGDANTVPLPASFLTLPARRTLERCYGVLFHYLEYQTIRPYLCHLLCLLTRRKHVRHYRITRLLSLRNRSPLDVGLTALIDTYAAFYPDLLATQSTVDDNSIHRILASNGGHVKGLPYPGLTWLSGVHELWNDVVVDKRDQAKRRRIILDGVGQTEGDGGSVITNGSVGVSGASTLQGPALSRDSLIRILPPPAILRNDEHTVAITEMGSFRELGYRMDRVGLPDHLASALAHRMTLVALLCRHHGQDAVESFERVVDWTLGAIEDQVQLPLLHLQGSLPLARPERAHQASAALTMALAEVIRLSHPCHRRAQGRLFRMLQPSVWTNLDRQERKAVLHLLATLLPQEKEAWQTKLIDPLCRYARTGTEEQASDILHFFATMLQRWSRQDWPSIALGLEARQNVTIDGVRLHSNGDYLDVIATTIDQANGLAARLLQRRPASIILLHRALYLQESIFIDALVGLHEQIIPPPLVLYLPGFSPGAGVMALSRQFGLIYSLRRLHQEHMLAKEDQDTGTPRAELVQERYDRFFAEECSDLINDIVILVVDLVWRNKGFVSVEEGTGQLGLSVDLFAALAARCANRGDELERIGSASHSANLALLMEIYANDLVRQRGAVRPVLQGPLTPRLLKDARRRGFPVMGHRDFRDSFLTWLALQGAHGISDLLNVTITRFIRGQEIDQSTVLQ